jgi:hypothetical protein
MRRMIISQSCDELLEFSENVQVRAVCAVACHNFLASDVASKASKARKETISNRHIHVINTRRM